VYKAEQIRVVHLEITSKCNASCPMCLRNICGGAVNPQLPLTELSLADIQKIFPIDFIRQLQRIYYCGNYGDPIVAQDTLESLKYFKSQNADISLSLFSNGSARSPQWWREVAGLTKDVHFAIDGLHDTNFLYRRGTNFETIIKNVEAFIQAGGTAIWDFIVFRHNEHQVEEAQKLASDLGFKKINFKKTGRFFSNTRSEVKSHQAVLDKEGKVEYYLEMPINPKFQNQALLKEQELVSKYGTLEKYLDQVLIDCKVQAENSIYVSAEGAVFPCCWTANQMYPWYFEPKTSQIWKIIDSLDAGLESISALNRPIQDIINGEFFKKIEESWPRKSTKDGKLKACAKTCGKEFDPFREQFR
jgi:MoaA/NifB/PqqE/SkfB family radical SAM enzyme